MARTLYRIAAVLILLFAAGHSAGFPWSDPSWGVDLRAMQTSRFNVLGFSRTLWDFYVGFGLTISVLLVFAALLAWRLGNLAAEASPVARGMGGALALCRAGCRAAEAAPFARGTGGALALCFAILTVLDWMYFFTIPIAMAGVITVCLAAAAWLSPTNTRLR